MRTCLTARYTVVIATQKRILTGYISLHFQKEIRRLSKLEEKRGLNFANAKRLIHYQIADFSEDAYEPGHSPQFLERIGCDETFRVRLKNDALPTLNKPLADTNTNKARILTEKRQREKVIQIIN